MTTQSKLVTLTAAACLVTAMAACRSQATSNNSTERKERILANLKLKYRQLEQLNPNLGDIKPVPAGMDEVTMSFSTPRGDHTQKLLVSRDDKELYMVSEPLDVSKSAAEIKAAQEKEKSERSEELKRLTAKAPTRGEASAPVSIVEFSDFQCPYCKRGFDAIEQVLQKYAKQVRFSYVNYPLSFHPWAKPAAIAANCAAAQKPEAFWLLHDGFFQNQQEITAENVIAKSEGFLAKAGLDLKKWATCAKNTESAEYKAASQAVDDSVAAGTKLGVEGTPAFFVNGEFLNGAVPFEELERLIQQATK